jgi:hypothetical protein
MGFQLITLSIILFTNTLGILESLHRPRSTKFVKNSLFLTVFK